MSGLDPAEDVIEKLRGVINSVGFLSINRYRFTQILQIHASPSRRTAFSDFLQINQLSNHQLIRDVDIRWSSTFLMIERALELQSVSQ